MGKLDVLGQNAQKKIDQGRFVRKSKAPPSHPPQKEKLTKAPPKHLGRTGRGETTQRSHDGRRKQLRWKRCAGKDARRTDRRRPVRICDRGANTNENAITEGKDALGRNRYIENLRSSQTIMIICGPENEPDLLRHSEGNNTRSTIRHGENRGNVQRNHHSSHGPIHMETRRQSDSAEKENAHKENADHAGEMRWKNSFFSF